MNIDWFTFAAQIVNFVVLVYLLNHFLYEPVTNAMKKREQSIASRLNEASQREAEARSERKKYRTLAESLESQRKELLEQARIESDQTRRKLVAEARDEVQTRRDDWLDSLHREQAALVSLVRQRTGQQVVEVSRNALSQLADAELEDRSLRLFLKQLAGIPETEAESLKREFADTGQSRIHTAFDISDDWRQRIETAVASQLGLESTTFVTKPELICGIELHIGGKKTGWSVHEYLESLSDELEGMLARP